MGSRQFIVLDLLKWRKRQKEYKEVIVSFIEIIKQAQERQEGIWRILLALKKPVSYTFTCNSWSLQVRKGTFKRFLFSKTSYIDKMEK